MRTKTVSGIMLTLLLMGMLPLVFNIQQVKANPITIVVPDDYEKIQWAVGNASSGDTVFVRPGTYYEHVDVNKPVFLIGENKDTTIIDGHAHSVVHVTADNVNISGFTIQSNGGAFRGIWLDNCRNVTVSGNNVRKTGGLLGDVRWGWGIRLEFCNGCTVERNNVNDSVEGISLAYSQGCRVHGNRVDRTDGGIHINSCGDSVFVGNILRNNTDFGIRMYSGYRCVFRDNNITGSNQNFGVHGDGLFNFVNDVDISNTIDGKPIVYLVNEHDLTVNPTTYPQIGYLAVVNSTNITVEDLNFSHNGQGVLFAYTSNSTIRRVSATHNECGIYLLVCVNCTVSENTATNNIYGIRLRYSNNNVVTENTATYNSYGIILYECENCVVSGNQEQIVLFWMERWFWTVVAIVIVASAGVVYFLKKRKTPTATIPSIQD